MVEGFTGDKRVFQDATRTFEVHVIKGLPHADGLVVGYLPKEKILVYADMFNLPPADDPVPNPPVVGTGVFADNIERLKLDVGAHHVGPQPESGSADHRGGDEGVAREEVGSRNSEFRIQKLLWARRDIASAGLCVCQRSSEAWMRSV